MGMAYVPAKWQKAGRLKPIRLAVLHCTVSPEMGDGAERVARYFQTTTRPASTHKIADSNSVVQCVKDENTAYGASGANTDGLHLELVGMPQQTRAQWLDAFSRSELDLAADVIADWCRRHSIPAQWLTPSQIRAGARGITTHADVEKAYPSTGHWDPGPEFPRDVFLQLVQLRLGATPPPATTATTTPQGADVFSIAVAGNNDVHNAYIAPDGTVMFRSGNILNWQAAVPAPVNGGKGKRVQIWYINGVLVLSVHGLDDEIWTTHFQADWTWAPWSQSDNVVLHP